MTLPQAQTARCPAATLTARAAAADQRAQAADPASYTQRHQHWRTWARRNHAATELAAALGVPVDAVTVGDDPHRGYGMARQYPGDLLTVTDPHTHQVWRFIPDFHTDCGWLLLHLCPHCLAPRVPVARIAALADLGGWHRAASADPQTAAERATLAELLPEVFTADPAHRIGCPSRD